MGVYYNGGLGGGFMAGRPINGTERIGTNFGLGGTLTKDTVIDANAKEFDFFQNVAGNKQTLHIGKTLGGMLDFVGEHIEDLPNNRFVFNGIADLSAFGQNALSSVVTFYDIVNGINNSLKIDPNGVSLISNYGPVQSELSLDITSVQLKRNDLSNNTNLRVLIDNDKVQAKSTDTPNGTSANIDIDKNGSILGSFTSHLILEGVGTTDKNFGYSAFTDRFTGAAAASATMYRYDQAIGLDERVFGINNDNLWASFLYDVTDNKNYSLLGFTAGSGFSRLYWGADVVAGSTDLANATYFEAGPNGLKLKGAIMSDQVETVAPTAIPGTYTKRIAIKDLNNNLLGYMPIL